LLKFEAVRASSAPLSQRRLRFDGWAGSWRASFCFCACIGTMSLESVLILLVILLLLSAALRLRAGLRVRNLLPNPKQVLGNPPLLFAHALAP